MTPFEQIQKIAITAAARVGAEMTAELKKVLSVPAPITPGSNPPRAATKATPGAPPRKVSGRGRAATAYFVEPSSDGNTITLYIGNSVFYMGVHERGNHKWLEKNINATELAAKFNAYLEGMR